MKRKQFLSLLKRELNKRRDIEAEEIIFYYDELIQDAIDNGEDEEVFIINLGDVKDIIRRIEDDEEFVKEVKVSNHNVLNNAISLTVKIIGYIIIGSISFGIAIAGISIFASGLGVAAGALFRMLTVDRNSIDLYGYLAVLGIALVGISLITFSVALVKWHFSRFNAALFSIIRKTNKLLGHRG